MTGHFDESCAFIQHPDASNARRRSVEPFKNRSGAAGKLNSKRQSKRKIDVRYARLRRVDCHEILFPSGLAAQRLPKPSYNRPKELADPGG
jgi:hypothetical protein